MQKLSKNLKVWLYASFILAGLAAILLTVALFTDYDSSSGYFKTSIIYSIFKGMCIVVCGLAVVTVLTTPKGALNGDSPLSAPIVFPSAFLALVFFCGGMILLGALLGLSIVCDTFTGVATADPALLGVGALFSFGSVVYFILNCFPKDGKLSERHALFGFSVPIAAAIYLSISYFDLSVSINAPIKLMTQLALIFSMLWMLYELRVPLKKPMPRLYFAFGILALFFSGTASLPYLIGGAANLIKSTVFPTYYLYVFVSLAMFCYIAVRLTVYVLARDIFERIADQTPIEIFAEEESEDPDAAEDPSVEN
ncbi:MAG: hypothetical protein IKB47_02605 [Clostridia bacterium]|nr:hypothetical protein [Clostridia bacterium]